MGLRSFFGFGKEKTEGPQIDFVSANPHYEAAETEGENPFFNTAEEENYIPEAGNYEEEVRETAEETLPDSRGTSELEQLYEMFAGSKKGGPGERENSARFNQVSGSLNSLNEALQDNAFGAENSYDDVKKVMEVSRLYGELLSACDQYLGRKALSGGGRARQKLVRQIRKLAMKDAAGIGRAMDELGGASQESRASMTWDKLLREVRTEKFTDVKLHAVGGGQASEIFDFTQEGAGEDGKDKLLFFKPETFFDLNKNSALWALKKYREVHPEEQIPRKELKKFRTGTIDGENFIITGDPKVADPESLRTCVMQAYANDYAFYTPGGMKGHGTQNVTGRNVASSRMADLLGVGHLLARSKFADVEEKDGTKRRGVVMEAASGTQGKEYISDRKKEVVGTEDYLRKESNKKKDAEKSGREYVPGERPKNFRTEASLDSHQGDREILQPGFLRDITNLQVLDVICGQADRHSGNMFFKTDDDGRLTGVTGIDNDGAFFLNEKPLSHQNKNRRDREVYGSHDEMVLPHMDAEMAQRVLALNPDAVRFALADILDKETIQATINRLEKVKAAIGSAEDGQIIQGDQWSDPSVRDDLMAGITAKDKEAENSLYQSAKNNIPKLLLLKYGAEKLSELTPAQRKAYEKEKAAYMEENERVYYGHRAKTSYLTFVNEMRRYNHF